MKMSLLLEMPWRMINTNCPNCDNYIENYDYFVELWDRQNLPVKRIKKIISSLMTKQNVPVICPYCEIYFLYNLNSHDKKIKPMPGLFKHNKDTIVNTYRERIPSFQEHFIYDIKEKV